MTDALAAAVKDEFCAKSLRRLKTDIKPQLITADLKQTVAQVRKEHGTVSEYIKHVYVS